MLKQIDIIEQSQNRTIFVFGCKVADYVKEKKDAYNAYKEEQRKERVKFINPIFIR